jgi:hypothetical protein
MPKATSQWITLIIRFWQQGYRGQVEHVQSGEKSNFKNLGELYEILHRRLGVRTKAEELKGLDKSGARRS